MHHVDRPWCRVRGEFEKAWLFESQSEYVTDGVHLDVLLPNFVVSFENLQSDFECMTTLLGLPAKLGHDNPSVLVQGSFQQRKFIVPWKYNYVQHFFR